MLKTIVEGCEPTKGSKYSACIDLRASKDVTIAAGETKIVPLGVVIDHENLIHNLQKSDQRITWFPTYVEEFKSKHYLQLMIRSSIAAKGVVIPNGVGIIDMDFENEIGIILHNPITEHTITWWIDRIASMLGIDTNFNRDNTANTLIKKGDKIAQITLTEHKSFLFGIETDTERTGGFGSTGK